MGGRGVKFLQFLEDKEEVKLVPKQVELEIPRIKVELTFVGLRDEVEIYTELADAPVSCYGDFEEDEVQLLKEYVMLLDSLRRYELDYNKKVLLKDYFKLAKAELKSVNKIKKEVTIYESKIIKKY